MNAILTKRSNPYIGPRSYKKGEKIYGRDREIQELTDILIANRIVLLFSPSGAGKTSLISAGLIPELDESNFLVFPVMRINRVPPENETGNRYVSSFMFYLEDSLEPGEKKIPGESLLRMTLDEYMDNRDTERALRDKDKPIRNEVFIIDQFEEILTVDPFDRDAKKEFFTQLGRALKNTNRWWLFAMREEYLGGLDSYLNLIHNRLSTSFRLDFLDKERGAREAVKRPAGDVGVTFTDDAVTQLVDNLSRMLVQGPDGRMERVPGPYVEPVELQVVCSHFWKSILPSDAVEVTVKELPTDRDIDQALVGYYEGVVHDAAAKAQVTEQSIRTWCQSKLITPIHTRASVLWMPNFTAGLPQVALDELENQQLIRCELRGGVRQCELTHDRLIDAIEESNRPEQLKRIARVFASKADVENWLKPTAEYLSEGRRLHELLKEPPENYVKRKESAPEQMQMDWDHAEWLLVCKILDGDISLAQQTVEDIFELLERTWLDQVLQLKAYFIWEREGAVFDARHQRDNYEAAYQQIRNSVIDSNRKLTTDFFKPVRTYLENRYLTAANNKIEELIAKKAYRRSEFSGAGPAQDWKVAEQYVKDFYENVIPAVVSNDSGLAAKVINAYDSASASTVDHYIVNCLESALVIYFLKRG